MKRISLVVVSALLFACGNKAEQKQKASDVVGLCSPLKLQHHETVLYLTDYFLQPERIDSFHVPEGLTWRYNTADSSQLILTGNIPRAYAILHVFSADSRVDILVKRSTRVAYTFIFNPAQNNYASVAVRGSFNAWNKNANPLQKREDGSYAAELLLQPGTYEYLMVLDDTDAIDPNNAEKVSNGQGGFNSVLRIEDTSPEPDWVHTVSHSDTGLALYLNGAGLNKDLFVFWQNQIITPVHTKGDTLFYAVPKAAMQMERSFVRAYTGNAGKFGNDLLIPLHKRTVVTDPALLTRNDWEAASLYFLMIDRFKNGNAANDSTVHDTNINPKANYFGGDIAGVTQALENGYFDSLGVNTVWISPVSQNPWDAWGYWDKGGVTTKFSGYHGYWPISNVRPDKRFASKEELQRFLDVAHARNKNVLLDYVANHVHQDHPIYQEHKDWATNLYLPDGTLNTERWDDQRLTTWFDTFMPTLDLRRPEIVAPMTDSAMVWITQYDFDGFRHDATKHIDELYWRVLTQKAKEQVALPQNKRVYQIGETYGSPELIASYISTGMLDAQFDFNFYDALVSTLVDKNGSFNRVAEVLNSSLQWYGHHHLMGNISGNQDRGRFISYASGDVRLSEDAKLAGWTREIGKPNAEAYKRLALLHALNFAVPGIPVIYYGDEYGMPGANDPDNRRMMQFDGLDADELALKETVEKLIALRNSNMALLYGSTAVTVVTDDVMIIHRHYFDEHVWFIINKGSKLAEVPMALLQFEGIENVQEGPVGDLMFMAERAAALSLGVHPNSFGILTTVKK